MAFLLLLRCHVTAFEFHKETNLVPAARNAMSGGDKIWALRDMAFHLLIIEEWAVSSGETLINLHTVARNAMSEGR